MATSDDIREGGNQLVSFLSSSGQASPMGLLARHRPKTHRTVVGALTAFAVYEQARAFWKNYQDKRTVEEDQYYISVPEVDDLYEDVQKWLVENTPVTDRRGLVAVSSREVADDDDNPFHSRWVWDVRYSLDGERVNVVNLEGHKIVVAMGDANDRGGKKKSNPMIELEESSKKSYSTYTPKQVSFHCESEDAREAVQRLLLQLVKTREKQESPDPKFYTNDSYSWRRRKTNVRRPLESVVLRDGVREELVDDLEQFLASESDYASWNMPWHRGYMLYGQPGTGKTSIAAALATQFSLDIYYLTLSSVEDDVRLNSMLSEIGERAILVIEDIDVLHASRERTDDQDGVTLGGLINALDGLVTPHGMITIMTTNNVDTLDDALLRTGRVDKNIEIEPLDDSQLGRLCTHFIGYAPELPSIAGTGITSADALGELKKHFKDAKAGESALREFIIQKRTDVLS